MANLQIQIISPFYIMFYFKNAIHLISLHCFSNIFDCHPEIHWRDIRFGIGGGEEVNNFVLSSILG